MSEASFLTKSLATEKRNKTMTFCMKLYTASRDVAEMVEELTERALILM